MVNEVLSVMVSFIHNGVGEAARSVFMMMCRLDVLYCGFLWRFVCGLRVFEGKASRASCEVKRSLVLC